VAIPASDVSGQKRAERSLAQRVTELGALYQFSDRLQRVTSPGDVYDAALDAMHDALGARRASILLFDRDGVMRFVAWRGLSDGYRQAVGGHSPWKRGENDAVPIWVEDVASAGLEPWLHDWIVSEGIRALGFVPLIVDGTLIGKFMLYYETLHAIVPEEDALALTIARLLASAVQRQRVEEERRAAAAALSEANHRKDDFLSTLAHELRNPLAPIVNMLAVLNQRDDDVALRARASAIIERQVQHLVRLVDDLLDVARIDHNRLELRRDGVALDDVVRQAVETCRPLLDSLHHELVVSLPPVPVQLDADPVRLAQVLGNLLNNAAKYTAPGGRIELRAERAGDDVVITVRDNGIGIPPEMLEQVFELFRQLDGTLERSHGGLGIGLTLVKRLVAMHGGVVEAASDGAGRGSAFTLRLPIPSRVAPTAVESRTVAQPSTPRRILVVDDNVDGAESLAELLRVAGHETQLAHDGREALAVADRFRPDVILLDLGLPGLDGFETCRAVRGLPWGADTSVIALTGWGQEDFRQRSEASGFDAHLVKPVDFHRLNTLIAER